MMGYYGGGLWMGAWGMAGMLLFWILTIVLVVWLVQALASSRSPMPDRPDARSQARQLLEHRFAAGEISREELEQGLKLLGLEPTTREPAVPRA